MKPATQGTGHESRHGRHKLGSIFRGGIPGLMCASKACQGGVQSLVTRTGVFAAASSFYWPWQLPVNQ